MNKTRVLLQILIGLVIIAFILNRLNINEVISALKSVTPFYFVMACIFYLFLNITLASRFAYLLKRMKYNIKFPDVFLSHMGGMFVGDITPGRSGYFLAPAILKNLTGARITDGMACIFAPQGLEFILKVGGAIAALIYITSITNVSNNTIITVSTGMVILLAVGIFMLFISWHNKDIIPDILNKFSFFNIITKNLSIFREKSILIKDSINIILVLYLISWIFAALHWFYIGRSLGIDLSFFAFFLLHPLITILMFVPASPAGLGLMEGGIILVFSFFGISAAIGLAFAALIRVSILLVDLIGLKTTISSINNLQSIKNLL